MHFQMAFEAAQLTDALPTVQAAVKLFLQSEFFHRLFSAVQTGKHSSHRESTGKAFIWCQSSGTL